MGIQRYRAGRGPSGSVFCGGVVPRWWLAALVCLGSVGLCACGGDPRPGTADAAPDTVDVADRDLGTAVVVDAAGAAADAAPGDSRRTDAPPPAPCEPEFESGDCEAKNLCGPVYDGCTKQTHQCNGCTGRQVCNPLTNKCQQPLATCSQLFQAQGIECGLVRNGCGDWLECPGPGQRCALDQECDPDTHTCRPCDVPQNERGCDLLGYECGSAWLGCGPKTNHVDCGGCPEGETCNDGYHTCEPKTCSGKTPAEICSEAHAVRGVECGHISDGCGGLVDCGQCQAAGQACGIAGIPNRCTEVPKPWECIAQDLECGAISSACGGTVHCGDCMDPANCYEGKCCAPTLTCDSPKYAGKCGRMLDNGCAPSLRCGCAEYEHCSATTRGDVGACIACVPKTQAEACRYPACGEVDDGCGGKIECGCQGGQKCYRDQCCQPKADYCTVIDCGWKSDGCGGYRWCGECPCTPRTACRSYKNCGVESDGCGGKISCGTCTAPQVCHSNQCCERLPSAAFCEGKCGTFNHCGYVYKCTDSCTCTPKSRAVACAGRCGTVTSCGVVYNCSCTAAGHQCVGARCVDCNWDGCGTKTGILVDACGVSHACGGG